MRNEAEKLRVLIPTTNGLVEILLLTEEDPAIGRCVACIGGTTETTDIAAAYHAFVVRPTGVIERLFGHPCYRLDVSGRIDAGSSWQLGVLAAHALHAAGRLAQEKDIADGVIWATGSVRPVDLTVGGVSHVPEKLASSLDRLKHEATAGRHVIVAVPEQNASSVSAAVRSELSGSGIEMLELTHAKVLLDALAVKLPEGAHRIATSPAVPQVAEAVPAPARRRRVWSAAAAAAACLCIAWAAFYLLNRPPATEARLERMPETSPRQRESQVLVPELVPFISERDQARIRDVYLMAPDHKALALSSSYMSFVTAQPDKGTADLAAVAACQKTTDLRRERTGRVRHSRCELYASGNRVVAERGRPPMPQQPWVIRNPAVEKPFTSADVPLVSESSRRGIERDFANDREHKALAVSPTGIYSSYASERTVEQAIRRALERCGYNSGVACMIVALDDVFVVPIPRSMKVVGLFPSGTINAITPELRDEVARRLGNATSGWNAVAIGASGRVGIKLGSDSEQAAVDGALDACGKQDRDCHVAVIGPFLVERGS
jgi:hypothetical protein